MKKNKLFQIMVLFVLLITALSGCEETIWPDVTPGNRADYLGTWMAAGFRTKTVYIRTQDLVTKDFSARDSLITDSIMMKFEFGIPNASGKMLEDSVRITTTQTLKGVIQNPVIKTGSYTIGETDANEYAGKALYINVWEKAANVHAGFANPVAEPFTTYTVIKKTGSEMELSWVLYNNTAQSSAVYKVALKK